MDADKIIVMDRGKIVGIGTHKDLMSTSEVYKDIYNSQIGKEGETLDPRQRRRTTGIAGPMNARLTAEKAKDVKYTLKRLWGFLKKKINFLL